MSELFFLEFIDIVKRNYKCFVINYSIYKSDLEILTDNYNGEILFNSRNENRVYFELNTTLVDDKYGLKWFDIWTHACEGWIMNNKGYELFKRYLNGEELTEQEIKDFIYNLICMFEYGDIHESIRFISFNDNLKKFIGTINFDFKDKYDKV